MVNVEERLIPAPKQFGDYLYDAMRAKGLTCKEFARILGVHEVTISEWRSNKGMPAQFNRKGENVWTKIEEYTGIKLQVDK